MQAKSIIVAIALATAGTSTFASGSPYPVGEGPYPPSDLFTVATSPSKSRAQVKAEIAAASRLGLLNFGEGDVPQATPEQERIIADAGRQVPFAEQREQGRTTLSAVR
jgi:hypothetical protein